MEKPIKAISPKWSAMPSTQIAAFGRRLIPWGLWGVLPSVIFVSGVFLYDTLKSSSVDAARPIELMSEVSVIALPMSADDKKAAEIRYLPMPSWQLEALPRRITPSYANRSPTTPEKTPKVSFDKPLPKSIEPIKTVTTELDKSVEPIIDEDLASETSSDDATNSDWDIDQLDFTGMSDDLVAQLKMAIADTQVGSLNGETLAKQMVQEAQEAKSDGVDKDAVVSLYALPDDVKHSLPKINLQTHLYSSVAEKRSIRVNGNDISEGEIMAEGVMLEKIEPRQVIFWFDGHRIAMPALSEW